MLPRPGPQPQPPPQIIGRPDDVERLNNWLEKRKQAQEGQRHLDVSRLTEAVHRQVPQLRYARAERRGVERAAGEVAQQ